MVAHVSPLDLYIIYVMCTGRTHDETAIALDLAHNYATMNPDFLHNNCSESGMLTIALSITTYISH